MSKPPPKPFTATPTPTKKGGSSPKGSPKKGGSPKADKPTTPKGTPKPNKPATPKLTPPATPTGGGGQQTQPSGPKQIEYKYFNTAEVKKFYLRSDINPAKECPKEDEYIEISREAMMKASLLERFLEIMDGKLVFGEKKVQFPEIPFEVHPTDGNAPVIALSGKTCDKATLEMVKKWCEYHANDQPWDPSSRFDDFDEDEYDLEKARLAELPCYWDLMYIQGIGRRAQVPAGGQQNRRLTKEYYDLMIAAHYLGVDGLVELGGKFLCGEIAGMGKAEVNEVLGIADS